MLKANLFSTHLHKSLHGIVCPLGKVLSTYWTYFLSEKRNVQVLKIYTLFIKIKCYFKVNINIVITSRKTLERDKFLKACL